MISSRLSEVCLVVQSIYLLSIVLLLSCVLLATMGGWQQIIPGLSRSTNYITMSMGYYRDKILANYICQLHWQKTPRLYPGAGDSGPFWWEIWAENDPSQPPVFRCSENTNIPASPSLPTGHSGGHLVLVLRAGMFFSCWQLGMFCQDQWKLGQWLKDSRIPTKKSVMKCTGLFRFLLQGENIRYFQFSQLEKLDSAVKRHFSLGEKRET